MGWYEALKDAVSAADKLRDADLKQKLASLQVECAKLAEDNAQLRQELLETREQANLREKMIYRDNAYWAEGSGDVQGPFCPKCLDGDRRAARMTVRSDDHCWRCPTCGCIVEKPESQRRHVSSDIPGRRSPWS